MQWDGDRGLPREDGDGHRRLVAPDLAAVGPHVASVTRPMADSDDAQPAAPMPCAPCRGTGQVISNLGGSPSQVACPWCEGTGMQIRGHDAQAARRASAA